MNERTDYQATQGKPSLWGREPVAIVAAVEAVLLAAIGFGLPVTGEQVALINVALMAVLALAARSKVTANANVVERVDRTVAGEDEPAVVAGPGHDGLEPGSFIRPVRGGYLTGQ